MQRHDTILLACGTIENRKKFRAILAESYNLLEANNSQQAILLMEQNAHCIAAIVLDITSPKKLNRKLLMQPQTMELFSKAPVIVITPDDAPDTLNTVFDFGAADAIPINYDPFSMLHRIENIVQLHLHKLRLETMVEDQSNALRQANDNMVAALSSIIEHRSVESGQHILRIRHFTQILLEELALLCPEYGLTESTIRMIVSASALHDIGKIAIPDAILTKPAKLTDEEMALMRTHALTGCRILESLAKTGNDEYLRYAHNICHYHHERWDGNGYPEGLSGDAIPICAQVVGLADAYDALTTQRVYKDAFPFETAVNMILQGECGQFAPKLLECFKHITDKYEALARAYADGLDPESETFDAQLPGEFFAVEEDSMSKTWAKYQALVHYANAFLLELDMDRTLFHLVYNPFPEMVSFHDISNFADLEKLVLDTVVTEQCRQQMYHLIHRGIDDFLDAGLRRVNHTFRFRSKRYPEGEDYEVSLLRINPMDSKRRTLAILCRKSNPSAELTNAHVMSAADVTFFGITESSYRCRNDQYFTLLHLDNAQAGLAGYTAEELKQNFDNRLYELIYPEDRQKVLTQFRLQLQQSTSVQLEHRVVLKSGQVLWVLNKSRIFMDEDGQECLYCCLTDITANKVAVNELNKKLNRYEIILAQTENVLFEWNMQTDQIYFSDTLEKVFGLDPAAIHCRAALLNGTYFHPDDLPLLYSALTNLENGSSYEMVELRIASVRGQYLWCRFRASAIRDAAGKLEKIVGIIINIEDEKQAEQALQDRAERDSLTKLLNKNAGRSRAEEYFQQFSPNINCALLIIDLDDFKLVNDQYGHLFGDAVLSSVAKEIKQLFRSQDIIARIGGDEFMVLMRGTADRMLVENRCIRLIETLKKSFRNQYHSFPLGCSIGIALAPEHSTHYLTLFQQADKALYQAKNKGKNTFVFFDPSDHRHRMGHKNATAINNRIDSDEEPGLADDNLVRHAFQRLYCSNDVDSAINDLLELVGKQMNVSRVYVFENSPDNRFCSNTYEWCNEGITPEIHNLQNISYETDIPNYEDNFNEDGIFYCPDIHDLPKKTYDIVAPQGIKSMLHCAIRDNGVFRGYIGFDECVAKRLWTKEQIQVLTFFSEMLSVFLMKHQAQKRTAQRAADLSSILDNQNAWIYIIDPDTCVLKYVNAKTKRLAPNIAPGMTCHKSFFGQDQRCENCPARNIRRDKTAATIIHNPIFCVNAMAEATLIQWNDEESCLLTCRDLGTPE